MVASGLDRHRKKDGEISRTHGETLVSTLRHIYGPNFAPGLPLHSKLSHVLARLDERSLSRLASDHEAGGLRAKIAEAGNRR
jgi:hypothetical protein